MGRARRHQVSPHPAGAWAEDLAERALRKLGWRLLDRNLRLAGGELDLVFADGRFTVFVEVRARSSQRYGSALASIGPVKARRWRRAALAYLGSDQRACRFDVVVVEGSPGQPRLRHLRAVILP